jgi:Ni/Co efflux regulator RcnB
MKRNILIAVATFALGLPVAPAAFARDYGGYRDGYRDRGDRHRDRDDRHDRHHDEEREERYVVHFHLDGGSHELRAKSSDRAERIVDFLRSVGADAHVDGRRTVHYHMRGAARIVRYSHEDAHRLAEKLEGYGFHAHVDHE